MREGKLIDFEGVEKAGKSTQIQFLAQRLSLCNIPFIITKEPRGNIRKKLLHGNPSPSEELNLFLKDRTEHFKEIILPALKSGKWVLCDRSSPSTIAYQHYARGLDLEDIKRRDKKARQSKDFDLIILLDIDPVKSMKRQMPNNRIERENAEFHQKVRAGYLAQAGDNTDKWYAIGAWQDKHVIEKIIWKEVQKRFLKNKKEKKIDNRS